MFSKTNVKKPLKLLINNSESKIHNASSLHFLLFISTATFPFPSKHGIRQKRSEEGESAQETV